MRRLSTQSYWDSIYKKNTNSYFKNRFWTKIKYTMRNYADYLIWENIFPKYISNSKGKKIIEVGCAPGNNLIAFKKIFNLIPYGVEYSENGFITTQKNMVINGIPEENIILADFFNDEFQKKYCDFFDTVYSKGFIEHFDNPKEVVSSHLNILKSEGLLIVQIPNLLGANSYISKFFNIDSYKLHNTSIMDLESFRNLFLHDGVDILFVNYVGLFNIGLFNTNNSTKEKIRLFVYYFIQQPSNLIFRFISYFCIIESKYTSPYLLLIAKKK